MTPSPRRALLLIDFQFDFLDDHGKLPVHRAHATNAIAPTRRAIKDAQQTGMLIVKIANEFRHQDIVMNRLRRGAALSGTPGAAWDPSFDAPGAAYVPKWRASAFCNPALPRLLADENIDNVTVAGLYARACVMATSRDALARGLAVDLLEPGIACKSDATKRRALARLERRGAKQVAALVAETHTTQESLGRAR
jgi:nicotinamidase-related amidase